MDATQYVFPDEPLVVFLYNPFGPEVMAEVARNRKGHDAYVVYVNPFYLGYSGARIGNAFVIRGLIPDEQRAQRAY